MVVASVQGQHELQTSDAVGAAGVQLGANVHATMAIANKELGLSHGKVKRLLEMLFGLKVGRSTSCRSVIRSAQRLEQAAEQIRKEVRGSPQVVADETGWRVDGGVPGCMCLRAQRDLLRDRPDAKRGPS
ncbi:MAG: transposase [Pirellulaceae bacterium]